MEKQNMPPNEPDDSESESDSAMPRLGAFGLSLCILGIISFCGSLFLMYFIMGAAGGLDIVDFPFEELIFIRNCGLFFGILGWLLGAVSLMRRKQ